ncbi:hypothetical protein [Xanthobacter wiegelii]|uniref:hypothetical protein n=1 Tax=Xanthobacter wiegelii TaxID=3119913 RepID=UPI00372639C3
MTTPWSYVHRQDNEMLRAVIAFLDKRLEEQKTVDWAVKLEPERRVERIAIEYLLTDLGASYLSEPWATAWRLIEESWSSRPSKLRAGTAIYSLQKRLRAGDRSGALIAAIVGLVSPRLKVEVIEDWRRNLVKNPRSPKTVEHILSARLTSGDLVDLNVLQFANLNDSIFLKSLANALEAAVNYGLDVARRLGWNETRSFTGLGFLYRAYYTQPTRRSDGESEPDAHHKGIAPSVKLLHAVVARLAEIEPDAARSIIQHWHGDGSAVFIRLWAAMARSRELVPAESVGSALESLDDKRFWDLHTFPEIAELRASRFGELDPSIQKRIVTRLRKGPPRNYWPKRAESTKVAHSREYWAVRELRRIEVAGTELPAAAKSWLDARLPQFADLATMAIDDGLPEGMVVRYVPPNPDSRYDDLQGRERLEALEIALAADRGGWDDDPAKRANDWISQFGHTEKVLADFEATHNGGDEFPRVWNRFGSADKPSQEGGQDSENPALSVKVGKVLDFLYQLSSPTLASAIMGVCDWMYAWRRHVVLLPQALPIWAHLWPIAAAATDRRPENVEEEELRIAPPQSDDASERLDLDALNTPAGNLVSVFLAACPDITLGQQAFLPGSIERQMLDILASTEGRSGLIAKHRMIEHLPYFLNADREWAIDHLTAPLQEDNGPALALWRAVARRTHFTKVLEIVGETMVDRANDRRLDRETRRRLVFSLVIESLHAFRENRLPAVPNPRIQQMLRTLEDEVRASAASAVRQFVREMSAGAMASAGDQRAENTAAAAALFRSAAAPFLREVWPQERSLATPGVSSAFADLPAASGEAFAEAVEVVARFLVPFECWSMIDYGLFGDDGEERKLATINDEPKARALLKLLDLTIGSSEGAVIPHDLTEALDQIGNVDHRLTGSPTFRRLATAARR